MNKISGLTYIKDFITIDEEKELLDKINEMDWSNKLKRRTQQYGYTYPYVGNKELVETDPIPDCFHTLVNKLNKKLNKKFDQLIINEYKPGQGIAPHIDDIKLFSDTIVSLSLGAVYPMNFDRNDQNVEIMLARCSVVILQDDARYKWKHSIVATKYNDNELRGTRISLTFREIN